MNTRRLFPALATFAAVMLIAQAAGASAPGYVYVPIKPGACAQPSPCAAPQVLVFDASTAAQVIAIDLPVHTQPVGVAISPDGRHLYVSNRGVEFSAGNSVSVIDARHHVLLATVSVAPSGPVAVARDDTRVFILDSTSGLNAFDTGSRTITAATPVAGVDIAASSSLDRVFVLSQQATSAFDTVSLAPVGKASRGNFDRLRASRDGMKLFDAGVLPFISHCVGCGLGSILDAATLGLLGSYSFLQDTVPAAEVDASQLVTFYVGTRALLDASTGNTTSRQDVRGLGFVVDFDVLAPGTSAAVLNESGSGAFTHTDTRLTIVDIASATVTKTTGTIATLPVDAGRIVSTPWGAPSCSYALDSASASFRASGGGRPFDPITGAARIWVTTDCAWSVTTDAPWIHVFPTSRSGSGYVFIDVDAQSLSSPMRQGHMVIAGQEVLVTQGGAGGRGPFGVIDTPANFATGVTGSIGVTGWALDDLAITTVSIFRDPVAGEATSGLVYLGDATIVEGARPDVRAAYPGVPFNSRAGWGYQLLTNVLPGGGTGTYRVYAYAADLEGNDVLLGTRTFTSNNATAALPFGALDTPSQGAFALGVITNWGWALTPQPASIAADGSTIDVVVDGVVVGHPAFGLDRPDVAALFPGYANTRSAVGYFTLDTTRLTNGVHTIAWVVRDSLGRAQGIGSRYFTVANQ